MVGGEAVRFDLVLLLLPSCSLARSLRWSYERAVRIGFGRRLGLVRPGGVEGEYVDIDWWPGGVRRRARRWGEGKGV